jgi:MFS family permease
MPPRAQPEEPEPGRLRRTFHAMRVPNFRRWFVAQTASQIGTWLQFMGQIWLVVNVLAPGNGFILGVTAALQSAPIVLTLWGGAIADHLDKRRLLIVTQTLSGVLALVLGVATLTGHVSLPVVWTCAVLLGLVNAADGPPRQAFVSELVGDEDRASAIALNSASFQATRAVGVALVPAVVALGGLAAPFVLNAASFGAVVFALATMDRSRLLTPARSSRTRPRVGEAVAAVRGNRLLLSPLVALAMVAVFALNFAVTLPLLATDVLHGGLNLVGAMYTLSSIGAVASSLLVAGSRRPDDRQQWSAALLLAAFMVGLGLVRSVWLAAALMFPIGACIAATTATTNTLLQQRSDPTQRGRIMAFYGLIMQGASLVGGPVIGSLSDRRALGASGGLYVGAAAALLGVLLSVYLARGMAARERSAPAG